MTIPFEPRLDELERRLRALEAELAELRELAGNGHTAVTVKPEPPTGLAWAEGLLEREDFRAFFRSVERARREALAADDLETLVALSRLAELAEGRAPVGVESEARRLGYTIRQNTRFVARKVGVELDEPELREPARSWEHAQHAVEEPRAPAEPRLALPERHLPDLSKVDLFGAKALAIAGGIVTALGIVFFFVLAVNRGWIGPEGRIGLGAFAAALAYGAGLELRRRYGETYSSLAAVAAGIAGGYAVLLAAAQLYHFVGHTGALLVAVAIAGLGLVTALRWRSQLIAALGLLGATLAPLAVAAQDGVSVLGTSFVAFMAVATAVVAIRERWDPLLVLGAIASLSQALALALQSRYHDQSPAGVVALSAIFAAVAVGTGVARQLREGKRDLGGLPTAFLFAGALFGAGCMARLYGSPESRGVALLVVAIALGLVAAGLFPRVRDRDLSALVGALGLVVGGIAFGELMSGSALAFAWAGEAAVLGWLSRRMREIRYQLFAVLYLAAAAAHVLAVDVTPRHLFLPLGTSAAGALAVVAVGAGSAIIAWQTSAGAKFRRRGGFFTALVQLYKGLASNQRLVRAAGYWLAALAAVYAVSLGVLAAVSTFDWGHVAMFSVWSALGLGLLLVARGREWRQIRVGALAWLAITLVAGFATAEHLLGPHARGATLLIVGAALLAAAVAERLPVALALALAEVGAGLAAFVALFAGTGRGLAFLGFAAVQAVLAARFSRDRDFSTLLWGSALVLGYGASERLLPGTYHVLVLSLAAGLLAWLSVRLREPRFLAAAGACVAVGVATSVIALAPPNHLFRPDSHPGHGALGVLFAAVAAAVVGAIAGEDDELRRRARSVGLWIAGVLAVYGLSLFILALFQASFSGSVDTNFHRGHTAVSAFWGLIGLALLYFGLTRLRALRVAGFATFAVSLVKIFVFDLPSLSSITRALSFLAVGAVLLAGGFFYQRLASSQPPQPKRARRSVEWPEGLPRPELAVGLVAALVLVVWFGSGLQPLGRPHDSAAAIAATPKPVLPARHGQPAGCSLFATATNHDVALLVDSCRLDVAAVEVSYPRRNGVFGPSEFLPGSRLEDCRVDGKWVRCNVDPPLTRKGSLLVDLQTDKTDSAMTVRLTYSNGRRTTSIVALF